MKWLSRLIWLVFGVVLGLVLFGVITWEYIGGMGFLGGIAQGIIKKKAKKAIGIKPPSPNRGFQYRHED